MSAVASKAHALKDRKDDFYPTPIEAVRGFLSAERQYLPKRLWEPACGDGAIVLPLRAAGHVVLATDLVDRGCPMSSWGIDFLLPIPHGTSAPCVDGIVTNPPFKLARAFVDRALDLAPYVAMLLRVSFLEGTARRPWFKHSPLARVHISSRRLPMMHRHEWAGPKSTSAIAFAWFVWSKGHAAPPTIDWFDWKDSA
jgi:hypothetical protein